MNKQIAILKFIKNLYIFRLFSSLFKTIIICLVIFSFGFVLPEQNQMPVKGGKIYDWNPKSFWYFPWGNSRVHKGIDIFARKGTSTLAPTGGLVLFSGQIKMGGNVVLLLGPKWRVHYFAHLEEIHTNGFNFVDAGEKIGTVGDSGNAKGKQPHLHYSIRTLFPQFWHYKPKTIAGWNRMFYVNPDKFLRS